MSETVMIRVALPTPKLGRVARYCRQRARAADDFYAREEWIQLYHTAIEAAR